MNPRWPLVLVLALATTSGAVRGATPRGFIADKVGDALSQLKAVDKAHDELPERLAKAREALDQARAKLKTTQQGLDGSQKEFDQALASTKAALTGCNDMGLKLKELPPTLPTRAALLESNAQQCTRLQGVETSIKAAKASTEDAGKQLKALDGTLADVRGKLDTPKDPDLSRLKTIKALLEAVLKINAKFTPVIPEFTEPK